VTEAVLKIRIPASLLQYGLDQNEIQRRMVEWLVLLAREMVADWVLMDEKGDANSCRWA